MKASTLGLLNDTDKAIECFDKSLEIEWENDQTWFLKGMTLFAVNRFNEADSSFDRAINLDPHNPTYWKYKLNLLV